MPIPIHPRQFVTVVVLIGAALISQVTAGGHSIDHLVLLDQQVLTGGSDHAAISTQAQQQQQQQAPSTFAGSYTVVRGDSLWRIAQRLLGDPFLWPRIYEANRDIIDNPNLIFPGQVLRIPGLTDSPTGVSGSDTVHDTIAGKPVAQSGAAGSFAAVMPVSTGRVTSNWGMRRHPVSGENRMHHGIDIGAPRGTPIRATGDGVVLRAEWAGGYGRLVTIRHDDGTETRYAHCLSYNVRAGQRVRAGEVIAKVNNTGTSTGDHLHFEVRRNGSSVNPRDHFDFPPRGSSL